MMKINNQTSKQAELLESKLKASGHLVSGLTFEPKSGKIYVGDGREYLNKQDVLVDVNAYNKAKILGAAGEVDKANALKIYSDTYLGFYETYARISGILEDTFEPYQRVLGAAGPEATLAYETIRRTGTLLPSVTGEAYNLEDFQAVNVGQEVPLDGLKAEYVRKTSSRLVMQKNLEDDVVPENARSVYATGTKEIYADAISFETSMRDIKESKANVLQEFLKDLPGAMLDSINDKVITKLNAITGNNQGDWDAVTGSFYDVDAAAQIQTAEDAVKKYGAPLICVMNSDAFRGYMKNQQGAYLFNENKANKSTSNAGAKTGTLPGNPAVTYHIDDLLTAGTYVLAAKSAYLKIFKGMVIQTSTKDPRVSGQTERRFWFNYQDVEETETSAQYKGTTVLA